MRHACVEAVGYQGMVASGHFVLALAISKVLQLYVVYLGATISSTIHCVRTWFLDNITATSVGLTLSNYYAPLTCEVVKLILCKGRRHGTPSGAIGVRECMHLELVIIASNCLLRSLQHPFRFYFVKITIPGSASAILSRCAV